MPRRHRAREFGGVTILVAGIVIGALGAVMWQGALTPGGFGAGLRNMLDSFRAPAPDARDQDEHSGKDARKPPDAKPSTDFDFFTELPSIEVLMPPSTPLPDAPAKKPPASPPPPAPAPAARASGSRYMLQAASYRTFAEADRLKARLAFAGLKSKIQRVSIEGRGDFYRVRLGPYDSIAEMAAARKKLSQAGIRDALRFEIKPR